MLGTKTTKKEQKYLIKSSSIQYGLLLFRCSRSSKRERRALSLCLTAFIACCRPEHSAPTNGKMASAFGVAASALAVAELAGKVLVQCRRYILAVKDAEKDIRKILVGVAQLKAILELVNTVAEDFLDDDQAAIVQSILCGPYGLLQACRGTLSELLGVIPGELITEPTTDREKWRKEMARFVKWPSRRSKAEALLDNIEHHKGTIQLVVETGSAYVLIELPMFVVRMVLILVRSADVKEIKQTVMQMWDTISSKSP